MQSPCAKPRSTLVYRAPRGAALPHARGEQARRGPVYRYTREPHSRTGESRPAVWYGEPVPRERAPRPCVTGSRPTREGAAVPRIGEPLHTQGPRHTGATPRMAAPHATPVGEGRPVMQRALSHTNKGAHCHVNGLSPWCCAKPTHACHPTHEVSRLCGGQAPPIWVCFRTTVCHAKPPSVCAMQSPCVVLSPCVQSLSPSA